MTAARRNQWIALLGWILASNLAGLIGALATIRASEFYRTLDRPGWAPPSWLFGPVWTLLYVLMGIAAWLVWRSEDPFKRQALGAFVVQLFFNALWSWIFFAWRMGAFAFAEIVGLAILIVVTMRMFGRISRAAGLLLAPYLAWVLFATCLTFSIWTRNRGTL